MRKVYIISFDFVRTIVESFSPLVFHDKQISQNKNDFLENISNHILQVVHINKSLIFTKAGGEIRLLI